MFSFDYIFLARFKTWFVTTGQILRLTYVRINNKQQKHSYMGPSFIDTRDGAAQARGGPRGPNCLQGNHLLKSRRQHQRAFPAASREVTRRGKDPQQRMSLIVFLSGFLVEGECCLDELPQNS